MALLALGLLAIGLVKLGPHPTLAHRPNSPATTVKVNKPQVAENYGKLPLSFEANQGQSDSRVDFLARGSGYTLFLTPTEAVLALRRPSASNRPRTRHAPPANAAEVKVDETDIVRGIQNSPGSLLMTIADL